jgi:hypothetical protein
VIAARGPRSARLGRNEVRAVPVEDLLPADDESRDGHNSSVADDLNEVVRPREDAVLVIDGDIAQMLDQMDDLPTDDSPSANSSMLIGS